MSANEISNKWISIDDSLPDVGVYKWRTALPLYVKIEGFGVSLAYPCKWHEDPFCWIPANIMCNDDQEYAPVNDKNQVINITHWMPAPIQTIHS